MVHYYDPSSGQPLCHSFYGGSHLLPSQLPGEHTGHKAASRHSEPIWNAHYSSIGRLNKPTSEESNDANNQGTTGAKPTTNEVKTKGHIVIPSTQGLCKSIKKNL